MTRISLTAAAIAALVTVPVAMPAVAQAVTQGDAQLAQALGVDAGAYSSAQLSALYLLQNDENEQETLRAAQILENPAGPLGTDGAVGRSNWNDTAPIFAAESDNDD